MSENEVYYDERQDQILADVVQQVQSQNRFGVIKDAGDRNPQDFGMLRGYLLQGVSRGQQALFSLYQRDESYRTFKIDLAGILGSGSKFRLKFVDSDNAVWFTTDVIDVDGLTAEALVDWICSASGYFSADSCLYDLGHPYTSQFLINNDELVPAQTVDQGSALNSYTGSWVFSIPKQLTINYPDYDIQLDFTADGSVTPGLQGPVLMAIYEIKDRPTGETFVITDVMEVASPTPLRAGAKVALGLFSDVGYGIIAAYPREYLFMQKTEIDALDTPPA